MALSGITTLQLNRNEFIAAAMRKYGGLAKGQVPDTEDLATGTQALNALVAEFRTLGMPLWAIKTAVVPLVANTATYTLTYAPTRVMQAWTELAGSSRQELNAMAEEDYNRLPINAGARGVPSQYMYKPEINSGTLKIWPAPDATTAAQRTLSISYLSQADQFVDSTDNAHFPQEWNNAIIYGLAELLAPEDGVPLSDQQMLMGKAKKHLDIALDAGQEWASLYFQPDRRWYWN